MMGRKAKLADIVNCCEIRFNRGTATNWKHIDYTELSLEIMRDTQINISPNTLKRIFGRISVDDTYVPQQATIDALVKYGGYTPPPEPSNPALVIKPVTEEPPLISTPEKSRSNKGLLIVISVFVLAGLLIAAWVLRKKEILGSISHTHTEGLLPATAFFRLQLPDTKDSIFINFGDKSALAYVNPDQKSTSHNYLFPGVFHVSMLVNQKIIDTATAYIRSDKWIGLGYHRQADLPDHYYAFPAVKTGADSLFYISNSQLFKVGLDTTGSVFTRLCNFSALPSYTSEDFVFETTFKNSIKDKGIYCNSTQFSIFGINTRIRFKLASPGCSSWVLNEVSEKTYTGNKEDLSQFVVALENWNTIKVINKSKMVSLYVNDKLLFSDHYQNPLGSIKGVFIEFEGTGYVKSCKLSSLDGKILYRF